MFDYLVRINITITKVVWPIITLTIVYFKEEPVVLPLKFWGPTSSECVTAFHGRCRLGRGRHNVEILCVCLWPGLDTLLKRGIVDNVYS